MANIKTVLKNTFFYSSSGLLLRASSIFLFPIFSYYLTQSDYGILSITQGLATIIFTFSSLQLGNALSRFAYKGNDDEYYKEKITTILRTTFTIVFLLNLLIFLFITFIGKDYLNFILNDIPYFPFVFFALMAMPITAVYDLYKIYLQAQHKGSKVFTLDMLFFGGNIGLNLLLVAVFKLGALGIIYSTLANAVVFIGYFLIREPQFFLPKIDLDSIKPLLKYSLPFIPFIFFGFLMENTDKFIVQSKIGSSASGIYYIAITFASIFSTSKESLLAALTPWFFSNFKEENYAEIKNFFHIIIWGMTLFAAGILIFSYEILYLLSSNPNLVKAGQYIPLFVIGIFIVFIGQLYALPTFHSKFAVKYLFLANLAGFITNLIGSYLLIERFELLGAGISKILAYTVVTITLIIINNYASKFRMSLLYVFLPLLFLILVYMGTFLEFPFWTKIFIKIGFMLISGILFLLIIKKLVGLDKIIEIIKSPLSE
ncbi:MAG: lipopolysaccharide biosynthesis protein [Aridibacter sp.]